MNPAYTRRHVEVLFLDFGLFSCLKHKCYFPIAEMELDQAIQLFEGYHVINIFPRNIVSHRQSQLRRAPTNTINYAKYELSSTNMCPRAPHSAPQFAKLPSPFHVYARPYLTSRLVWSPLIAHFPAGNAAIIPLIYGRPEYHRPVMADQRQGGLMPLPIKRYKGLLSLAGWNLIYARDRAWLEPSVCLSVRWSAAETNKM